MPDYDDILAASLDSSFQPSSEIPKRRVASSTSGASISTGVHVDTAESQDLSGVSSSADSEAWKEDYDKNLERWRAESAISRREAEEKRSFWEQKRREEREKGVTRQDDWEKLRDSRMVEAGGGAEPSPADGRDLVSGESEKGAGRRALSSALPPPDQPLPPYPDSMSLTTPSSKSPKSDSKEKAAIDSLATSHQWTNLQSHSNESSFPDIDFPSRPASPGPSSRRRRNEDGQPHPPSATLTIFDTSLSVRTRVLALSSAIAINFLLPFVNGVMLGFGEIFAKGIVGWLGWNTRGAGSATAVGIGAVSASRRQKMA